MTEREAQLEAKLALAEAEAELLRCENQMLRQKVDLLIRQLFGSKSERIDPAQMDFFLREDQSPAPAPQPQAPEPPVAQAPKAERRERTPRVPEDLPGCGGNC